MSALEAKEYGIIDDIITPENRNITPLTQQPL
jgi:ATP-dependent protease ClpP protease subunit